jgi:hypothetical protein
MSLAALTASGFLWTTHLSEADQGRFVEFEKEFRRGYKLEKAGQLKEARDHYEKLKKRYVDHPQANHLVTLQIEKLITKPGKTLKKSASKKFSSPRTKRTGR